MKRTVFVALLGSVLLAGCLVPGRDGLVLIPPPLPAIVELDLEPFYFHSGYYYRYYDDRHWAYSRAKDGPYLDLPRDRYPNDVRWKSKGHDRGRGRGHERWER